MLGIGRVGMLGDGAPGHLFGEAGVEAGFVDKALAGAGDHGRDGGVLDVVGRVEVGLAGRKADDVAALGRKLARQVRHGDGGRGFDARQRIGQKPHENPPV